MRIGYDLFSLYSNDYRNRGVGVYCKNLINEVEKHFSQEVYKLNCYGDVCDEISVNYIKDYHIRKKENYCFLTEDDPFNKIIAAQMQHFCIDNDLDVFHYTAPYNYEAVSMLKLPKKTAKIATIHDFIQLHFPEHYLDDPRFKHHYMRQLELLDTFDAYITVSENTADDMHHFLNVPREKVFSIYHGANSAFRVLPSKENPLLKKRIGISDKFIIYVGGPHFTKNPIDTVKAYAKLGTALISEYQLVMLGISPEMKNELISLVGIDSKKDRIVVPPYLLQEELVQLYNMAELCVFASKYEGFGFPLIEAFACGVPAVTSNNSSLAYLGDGCTIQVDPFSIDEISNGIRYALTHPEERERLSKAGLAKVAELTWQNTASKTVEVYKEVVERKDSALKLAVNTPQQKSIAWFSPIPPQESGIAGYSYEILTLLQERLNIDIFVDIGFSPETPSLTKCDIYPYTKFKQMHKYKEYDAIVYQMGCSTFHTYLLDIMEEFPGIVVSHDTDYHNLLTFLYHSKQISDMDYLECLVSEFGAKVGRAVFDEILSDDTKWINHPLSCFFLGDSKKVIAFTSHNRNNLLEKRYGTDISVIHLHSFLPENYYNLDAVKIKDKVGLPVDSVIVSAFGNIHHSKRNLEALKAFEMIFEKVDNVYFYFVGNAEKDGDCYVKMQEVLKRKPNLKKHVIFTGYVSDEELIEYLKITDISINLRGEGFSNSGPLIRSLGAGIPCIVSNIEVLSDVDNDSVIKIDIDKNEIPNISSALLKLITDSEYRQEYGQKALALSKKSFQLDYAINKYEEIICNLDNSNLRILLNNSDIDFLSDYYKDDFSNDIRSARVFSREVSKLNKPGEQDNEAKRPPITNLESSGIGNSTSETALWKSVRDAGYTELEMQDYREPAKYSMKDYFK